MAESDSNTVHVPGMVRDIPHTFKKGSGETVLSNLIHQIFKLQTFAGKYSSVYNTLEFSN